MSGSPCCLSPSLVVGFFFRKSILSVIRTDMSEKENPIFMAEWAPSLIVVVLEAFYLRAMSGRGIGGGGKDHHYGLTACE